MAAKLQKNNNDDEVWDNNSECSNVSANTDFKVFHGAINNNDDYFTKLNSKTNLPEVKGKQSNFSMFKKPINQSLNKLPPHKSHSSTKEKEANNEQLSFRNECDIIKDEKNKQPFNQASGSKSADIKSLYDEDDHSSQNIVLQNLILKFKDFSDNDSNINIPGCNYVNLRKDNKQMQSKTFSKSMTTFRISSIDKGIALLVSTNDCIFTMPTFLLPKGVEIGNSYSICIEETKKGIERKNNICAFQNTYLR